jgi:hypothetical protein
MNEDSSANFEKILERLSSLEKESQYRRGLWKGLSISAGLVAALIAAWFGYETIWGIPGRVHSALKTTEFNQAKSQAISAANDVVKVKAMIDADAKIIEELRAKLVSGDQFDELRAEITLNTEGIRKEIYGDIGRIFKFQDMPRSIGTDQFSAKRWAESQGYLCGVLNGENSPSVMQVMLIMPTDVIKKGE